MALDAPPLALNGSRPARTLGDVDDVKRIIAKILRLPVEHLTRPTRLVDLGAASMDAIEIVYEIEEKFEVSFPMQAGDGPLGVQTETPGAHSLHTQLNTIGTSPLSCKVSSRQNALELEPQRLRPSHLNENTTAMSVARSPVAVASPTTRRQQGDYDWSNANQTNSGSAAVAFAPAAPLPPFAFATYHKLKSLASVTGRVGYAFGRFLGYAKGGGAWEQSDYSLLVAGVTGATVSETKSGWTVGVGGEYAFLNSLSGFIEYDFYRFGNNSNSFACAPAGCAVGFPAAAVANVKSDINVLKVGLNLKFL